MAEMPFFPLATDAFLADTDHLTDEECGRYMRLLIALWRAPQQRLPNDDKWLAKKFRRTVESVQSELRPLIVEFCQNDGNWITQKRISKEFKRAAKQVKQRRDAANARWAKEKEESGRNANTGDGRNAPRLIPTPTLKSLRTSIITDPARGSALEAGAAPRAKGPSDLMVAQLAALRRNKVEGTA